MRYLLFICLFAGLFSCKKEPIQYTFEGTITDNLNNAPIPGVDVKVYHKPFSNGVQTSTFSLVGTYTTSSDGFYTTTFEREASPEYKITMFKQGYFYEEFIISSGEVTAEEPNTLNKVLEAETWVKFDIENVPPADVDDVFQLLFYDFREGCDDCIQENYNFFDGALDTVLSYQNTSGQYLKFTYGLVGSQSFTDSLYMIPLDTVYYTIQY